MATVSYGNILSAVAGGTDEERAEFYRLLFPDSPSTPTQVSEEFEINAEYNEPDEDFCLGRVLVKSEDPGNIGQGHSFHNTYGAWGWKFKRGFLFAARQCGKKPGDHNLCNSCNKNFAKFQVSKKSSKTQWYGIWGQDPPADAHCQGSDWAEAVINDKSPPRSK